MAIIEIGITPARITLAPSEAFTPNCKISPKPDAPTKVPNVATPTHIIKALRTPPIITDRDKGNSTL